MNNQSFYQFIDIFDETPASVKFPEKPLTTPINEFNFDALVKLAEILYQKEDEKKAEFANTYLDTPLREAKLRDVWNLILAATKEKRPTGKMKRESEKKTKENNNNQRLINNFFIKIKKCNNEKEPDLNE